LTTQTADLHFHTTFSDGKHSVAWVTKHLNEARAAGLEFATLTDHDGFSGFDEFEVDTRKWQKPICASELSCTYSDRGISKELHLLIYGLDPHEPELKKWVETFRVERETRFLKICEKLNKAGYPIDAAKVAAKHGGVLGRPHVADALVEMGVVRDRSDAFDRFLKEGAPYCVPKWRFPLEDAIRYAKKHGCKTSIAHPGQYKIKEDLLSNWKDLGVDAIEIYHPRHTTDDRTYYLTIAKRLGFHISGGSDFHTDETDLVGAYPSLGRTEYPLSEARIFLGDLL
jgi:predicted metal-dependent phosphoesterase TrpH